MAQAQGGTIKTEVAKLLRSVLMTNKDGIPINNLQREYSLIMGCKIPFRELKANSLEEFLKSMPDVVCLKRNYSGELTCYAVADENSKHVASLVSRTRSKAPKPKKSNRRRVRSSAAGNMTPYRINSPTTNRYQRFTIRRGQPNYSSSNSRSPFQSAYQNNVSYKSQQQQQHMMNINNQVKRSPPQRYEPSQRYEPPPRFNRHSSGEDLNPPIKPSVNGYVKTELSKEESGNYAKATSDKNKENVTQNYEQPAAQTVKFNFNEPMQSATNSQTAFSRFKQQSAAQAEVKQPITPLPLSPLSPTYNDPLTPPLERDNYDYNTPVISKPTRVSNPRRVITPEVSISPEPLWSPPSLGRPETNVDIVTNYAKSKGIIAKFKTVNTLMKRGGKKKPLNMFLSTLTLADYTFQSYPIEKPTPKEADEEAARKAVEELNLGQMDPLKELPVTPHKNESDIVKMLERIVEIVAPKQTGVFHLNVQKKFRDIYKESLPSHWLDTVRERRICKKIETVTGDGEIHRFILYPLSSGTTSPASLADRSTPSECDSPFVVQDLPFPEDDQWEIHVSYVANTLNVFIQLVDYSQQFEDLSTRMEEYFKIRNFPINELVLGGYYALQEGNAWYRVEVTNFENNVATCYFLDHGDIEDFNVSLLQELPKIFLDMPFQAISCQLTGLEFLADDNQLTEELISLVFDKTLVGEVKSREGSLSLILYDTSTDEDVNLNKTLLNFAINNTLKPALPLNLTICEGYFSHVNDVGDVYLRPNINGLNILCILIQDLTEIFQENMGKVSIENVSLEKMYVAKGMMDEWCRCLILEPPNIKSNNMVFVTFIDFGIVKNIPVESIVELNSLSDILVKFPSQVIICHLHEVPNKTNFKWTLRTSRKMLEMIELTQPLSIKIIPDAIPSNQTIPIVELFKRTNSDELVSINLTLAVAIDLFDPIAEIEVLPRILKSPGSLSYEHSANNVEFPPTHSSPNPLNLLQSPLEGSGDHGDIHGPPLFPVKIPEVGETFDVYVLWAVKPDLFYVQSRNEVPAYQKLLNEMQQFYNNEENLLDFEMCLLNSGSYYAIKHDDGNWYRGYVSQIISFEPVMVVVNLVDYGEFIQVTVGSIQILWKRFRTLHFQAIKAKLTGIAPLNFDYELSHITDFQNMVTDKLFVSIINSKELDQSMGLGGYELGLTLIDTSTEQDIYIGKNLVEKGYAKFV